MHYIDLLNYLIDVQKIEKDELCELIAIPKKKLDSVLSGIIPLKKKCLKNLSQYTSIPLDAIRSGNFVLNIPQAEVVEGEEAPKIIKDAYVPEYIREANTKRLKAYCKKRYKNRRDDVLGLNIINIILFVINIITAFFLIYSFNIFSLSGSAKVLTIALIPTILSIFISANCYKLAWNGTLKEEKLFVFYAMLNVIQILTYTIALVVAKWAPPFSILFALLAIAPIIYTIFLENKDKSNYIKSLVLMLFSALSTGVICILASTSELFMNLEDERAFAIGIIINFIGFLIIDFTTGILLSAYTFYRKRNFIAKHFEPVSKKSVFKGNKIAKDIIVILLLISLTCGVLYVLPIIEFKKNIAYLNNSESPVNERYHDYDKDNIIFSEEEKVVIIEYDNYSLKIPGDLKKSSEFETYTNEEKYISIMIKEEVLDIEEFYNKLIPVDIKKVTIDKYGFFPKSQYEEQLILKSIYDNDISIFDRDLSIAANYFFLTDANFLSDSDIYLHKDSEIEFCIKKTSFKKEDKSMFYTYDISGNAVGNYDKFFNFTIGITCDDEENDIAYKIINSIEIK